jgi:hypothetical protein
MIVTIEDLKEHILKKKSQNGDLKCEHCGKELKDISYNRLKRTLLFGKVWCTHCRTSWTLTQRYGYSNNFQKSIEKIKQTKIEHFGSLEEAYAVMNLKTRKTKKERYGNEKYTNKEKAKQTCLEKYGVEHPSQVAEFQKRAHLNRDYKKIEEKRKQTCLERYGTESFCSRKRLQEAIIEKYGSLEAYQKYRQQKTEASNLKKYGVKSTLQCPEVIKKAEQTKREKYGQEYSFYRSLYVYDNKHFDSSWELAYFIWLKDNNKNFIFKPERLIWYDDNNKEHYYYPDFLIDDSYYEIKGDHLFNENEEFISPYTKRVFKEKSQLIKKYNVHIIKSKEIDPILRYIKERYGSNYLSQFKRKKV